MYILVVSIPVSSLKEISLQLCKCKLALTFFDKSMVISFEY